MRPAISVDHDKISEKIRVGIKLIGFEESDSSKLLVHKNLACE